MNPYKTCLSILLGLVVLTPQVGAVSKLDLASGGPKPIISASAGRLFGTVLTGTVIYWRAGSFTPATSWTDLTEQANAVSMNARGLILDLRSNSSPADVTGALRLSGMLAPQQSTTFTQASFRSMGRQTVALNRAAMIVVLTNRETRGAAESLAIALQSRGALIMGQENDGRSAIVPDVTTTANAQDEVAALALIDRQQVHAVITEAAVRHRMSEAALVRGQDPEQDAFIASHEQDAPVTAVATHDIALVEALDSFKAIRVLQGEESSPQPRVADLSSTAGLTVIASSGLR